MTSDSLRLKLSVTSEHGRLKCCLYCNYVFAIGINPSKERLYERCWSKKSHTSSCPLPSTSSVQPSTDFSVSMETERAVDMDRELSLLLPSLSPSLTLSDEKDRGDSIVSSV